MTDNAAPKVEKLSEAQVAEQLDRFPAWSEASGVIQRTYQFRDFVQAMKFVNTIADEAERRQHHPDILVRWNKVTLTLSTHDAGGISHKDFEFAQAADAMA